MGDYTLRDLTSYYLNVLKEGIAFSIALEDINFLITESYNYGDDPTYEFEYFGKLNSIESFFKNTSNPYLEDYEEHISLCYGDIDFFPIRETREEALEDMRKFLIWAIERQERYNKLGG